MENNMRDAASLVCVIMPAYNAERFIETAIRSVMAQTYTNWELIVIDDCSKDATVDIVERLALEDERVTLLRNEENQGVAKTRNRGLDLCKGSYVAFLDSDDIWYPEKLEKQLVRMKAAGADIGYCSYSLINVENEKIHDYLVPEQVTYEKLLKENVIGCSTVVLSANLARNYRFQLEFYHEDYVLWLQLLKAGYVAAGCSEVLANWRYLENSRSFNKWKSAKNRWKIYRKYLKLPLAKSTFLVCNYAVAGLKKYRKRDKVPSA